LIMKPTNFRKTLIAAALIGAAALSTVAIADPQHGGYGMGPGMMGGGNYGPGTSGGYSTGSGTGPGMTGGGYGPGTGGGYGPGMMGGYGPGYGMGPGMMGGYGHGYGMSPGMMRGYGQGYGMGPGMMRGYGPGYGMGPGMMRGYGPGYGMGPGMMGGYGPGYGMPYQLNLTLEQRNKLNAIHEELAKKNRGHTARMQEEAFKLRNLMSAENPDRAAITNQYKKLQELRQQRFTARLDAREKIDGVFTKEQKQQLRRFAPCGQNPE